MSTTVSSKYREFGSPYKHHGFIYELPPLRAIDLMGACQPNHQTGPKKNQPIGWFILR
jgi:hypothetical protein